MLDKINQILISEPAATSILLSDADYRTINKTSISVGDREIRVNLDLNLWSGVALIVVNDGQQLKRVNLLDTVLSEETLFQKIVADLDKNNYILNSEGVIVTKNYVGRVDGSLPRQIIKSANDLAPGIHATAILYLNKELERNGPDVEFYAAPTFASGFMYGHPQFELEYIGVFSRSAPIHYFVQGTIPVLFALLHGNDISIEDKVDRFVMRNEGVNHQIAFAQRLIAHYAEAYKAARTAHEMRKKEVVSAREDLVEETQEAVSEDTLAMKVVE